MPAVVRQGDTGTGHGPFPPRANTGGSPDVLVNGLGVHRQGDPWASHCDPSPSCHPGAAAGGSGTVLANGMPVMRIGDDVDCGSAAAQGSGDVFAG